MNNRVQRDFNEKKTQVMEFFRKTHHYDDWTLRAQLPDSEKAALERFILESSPRIQNYFEVSQRVDVDSFTNDFILLKGRKRRI